MLELEGSSLVRRVAGYCRLFQELDAGPRQGLVGRGGGRGGGGAPWKQQITGGRSLTGCHSSALTPSCLMSWLLVSLRNLNPGEGAKF